DTEFCHLGVVGRRAVEGRGEHLALHRPLHVRDLFGPLVHEDHHEVAFRVVDRDRVGDVLQHRGLTGLRRGDDQRALSLPDRHDQVDHPGRQDVLLGLQTQPLVGVQRGELSEVGPVTGLVHRAAVDRVESGERVELLTVLPATATTAAAVLTVARHADGAGDRVTAAQAVATDHVHRDVDVVGAREVTGRPHERVVVQDVQDPRDGLQDVILPHLLLAVVLPVPAAVALPPAATAAATTAAPVVVPVLLPVATGAVVAALVVLVAVLLVAVLLPVATLVLLVAVLLPVTTLVVLVGVVLLVPARSVLAAPGVLTPVVV